MDRVVCVSCGCELKKLNSGLVLERVEGDQHSSDLYECPNCGAEVYLVNETPSTKAINNKGQIEPHAKILFRGDSDYPF